MNPNLLPSRISLTLTTPRLGRSNTFESVQPDRDLARQSLSFSDKINIDRDAQHADSLVHSLQWTLIPAAQPRRAILPGFLIS
jgi:hypothetical protein